MNDVKVKSNYPSFTIVYNDFLDSEGKLSGYEKLIFILLLRYGNNAFPSKNTLVKKSGFSVSTIKRTLKSLEEKGILSRESRKNKFGGDTSNAYILKNYSEFWKNDEQEETKRAAKNDISDEEFEKMARERGYIKVKEPVHRTAKQEQALKSKNKLSKSDVPNSNSNISVSQLDNITKVNNSQGKNNNVN
ncbi:MAG: helix-turn-helix domain-containing protein, partial [Firmicutes bacterium]|nr:helix-turn-helix domain-containing protein [Bacillota bacterium]